MEEITPSPNTGEGVTSHTILGFLPQFPLRLVD